jgi:hypothetical protein
MENALMLEPSALILIPLLVPVTNVHKTLIFTTVFVYRKNQAHSKCQAQTIMFYLQMMACQAHQSQQQIANLLIQTTQIFV